MGENKEFGEIDLKWQGKLVGVMNWFCLKLWESMKQKNLREEREARENRNAIPACNQFRENA